MRKILALLFLAGAATPALAAGAPGDRHGWQSQSNQQSNSDNHPNRSDGNDRPRRANRDGDGNNGNDHARPVLRVETSGGGGNGDHVQPVTHVETSDGGNSAEHRHFNGVRSRFSNGNEQPAIQPSGHDDSSAPDSVRSWRGPKIVEPGQVSSETHVAPTLRRQDRPIPNVFRNRVPIVSHVPREGTQPPLRVDSRSRDRTHSWNTSWRNNQRYDWQDWRRHHRSHFHLGLYFDPFGWAYQPYQIGWRLWPNYYNSSRYWINDPWEYRLPYAPPGYRWIRYWDDAILVDTFTGEAVDVIHNFFW